MQILKLMNLQTVKLKKMKKLELKVKKDSSNKENYELEQKLSKHLKTFTDVEKEKYEKNIKKLQSEIEELNITNEIRNKNRSELTDEEYDKLYDEYVYKGLIKASESAINEGYYEYDVFLEYLKEKYGVKIN